MAYQNDYDDADSNTTTSVTNYITKNLKVDVSIVLNINPHGLSNTTITGLDNYEQATLILHATLQWNG